MQEAAVVLSVLRERGRKGLPLTQLYRQMFSKNLYLLAYGNIYSNQGAMTPGASEETADGMTESKIDQIIELMRYERYRFSPARRIYVSIQVPGLGVAPSDRGLRSSVGRGG
jgi:hypothetical protein